MTREAGRNAWWESINQKAGKRESEKTEGRRWNGDVRSREMVEGRHGAVPYLGYSRFLKLSGTIVHSGRRGGIGLLPLSREGFNQSRFAKHLPSGKEIEP